MFDSVAGSLRAILWPLAGAAFVLTLGQLLPGRIRRIVASAAALASLVVLWSLPAASPAPVKIFWEPLNLFRMGPSLQPDGLGLLAGLTLAGLTAAAALGIRGASHSHSSWQSLMLIVLAGGLIMIMATNVMALVLGSALVDLALIFIALTAREGSDNGAWRMAVPGVISTLVLFFASIQMDIQVGNASLSAHNVPTEVILLVAIAGTLRLMVFPIQPRNISTPEHAATQLLPIGLGLYLLARAQTIAPILADQGWLMTLWAVALVAGGVLAWVGKDQSQVHPGRGPVQQVAWSGIAIHQVGVALGFVVLLDSSIPWSLPSVILGLGMLAILWDASQNGETQPMPARMQQLVERGQQRWGEIRSLAMARAPLLEKWSSSQIGRRGYKLFATVAFVSLAGTPFTIGGVSRWSLYAAMLHRGEASLLIIALVSDILLCAGLWSAFAFVLHHSATYHPRPTAWIPLLIMTVLLVLIAVAPGLLTDRLGLEQQAVPDVSVWGLGLIFVLPWLVGGWLSRFDAPKGIYAELAYRIVGLDWLYRASAWMGQRFVNTVGWFGKVGEGEGWWGWALIIMSLGVMFFILR